MEDKDIDRLIEILRTSRDEVTRRRAAKSLGKIGTGNSTAIEGLAELLRTSQDEYTRWLAAETLGKIGTGNPTAIEALAELLRTSRDEYTRWRAAEILGKIGTDNPTAIARLAELLRTSQDEDTRRVAAVSLEKIGTGNPTAIAGLAELLRSSRDEYTRRLAAKSLGEIGTGNERAIEALLELLRSSRDEYTRRLAAESLGKIDPGNPTAIKTLLELLRNSQDESTRRLAAESLGKIGTRNPTAIKALLELVRTSQDECTRREAAKSLGDIGIGNPTAIEALLELLRTSQDEYTRRLAAGSLGKIGTGNPTAIEGLLELLRTSQDEYTRQLAVESLEKIGTGNPKAIKGFLELLRTTEDEDTRWLAAWSLGKIGTGNPTAIKGFLELLRTSQNEHTRRLATQTLGTIGIGNPTAIEGLLELLRTSRDESTRRLAAGSLETIGTGNPTAIKGLLELLRASRDWGTRRLAAETLGKIGTHNPTAIEGLVELLRTTYNESTRRLAVQTLGKIGIGNPTAIEGLRELLHTSQSEYTRSLVTEILGKIDPRTDWQPQMAEDDLLLFLRLSRVKETADRYFYHNYREKTKFCYQRIIACLDRLQEGRDLITRRSLMESYLQLYKRIVAFSIHIGDLKSAFFYAELFRNRYLVERIAQQDAPLPKTVRPELAAQIERAKQAERKTLQAYTEGMLNNPDERQLQGLNAHWDEAKKALEDLYRQVAEIEPEFIAKTKVYPISFSEVQRSLPPDTGILEFFFTDTRLVTILILPGAESPIIPKDLNLDFKQAKLESLARNWMADISAGGKAKKGKGIERTIQDLPGRIDSITDSLNFRKLLNPIPSEIKHLIVVPHSYLYLFPIHALWLNDSERLIDRFTVQYFPNLQVWKICQNRRRSGGSFIGIENPTQDKDLIFAKAEVASICRRFVPSCVLRGGEASKLTILETAKGHNYFHFSGHAEYNFDSPLDSYLMLSPNRDENLTLSAILADTHMPEADLVTLSACCTGVVDAFQPVDECLGMATGFLLAGAKGVISSLWKVNSIATAFLIDEFYRQFEVTNNKAVALQKAQQWLRSCTADDLRERATTWDLSQLELIEERIPLKAALRSLEGTPFENPYYWAAFILTGC